MSAIRIASYNIRAGLGVDLRRDSARTLRAIAALDASIVALQEADFRLGTRPSALPVSRIKGKTGLIPLPLDVHPESLGWHGNAILLRPDIRTVDRHLMTLPGLEPRGAIISDHVVPGVGPLRLIAVHLGLLRSSRRRQLSAIKRRLTQLAPRPTLWMGDFNERSERVGLGRLLPQYKVVTPGPSYPVRNPVWALDRIAHCDQLRVSDWGVAEPPDGDSHASDHRPILARLSNAP
ncbi:MAG: endonuclease/exonuclease/phosphatase family protein [Dinoroseobacter sp.]|nr:endonuclease/exonuclease/phosphatase family protein [Dinoroseobacter sp.]